MAKFAAAEKALVSLRDTDSGELLAKLCDCKRKMVVDDKGDDSAGDQRSNDEENVLNEQEEREVVEMLVEEGKLQ